MTAFTAQNQRKQAVKTQEDINTGGFQVNSRDNPHISRLLVDVPSWHLHNIQQLLGSKPGQDLRYQMLPLALDVIRHSLLGLRHPFETLQSLNDWCLDHFVQNPHMPREVDQLLQELIKYPNVQLLYQWLLQPDIARRLQLEWFYDMTIHRFMQVFPYLDREFGLQQTWATHLNKLDLPQPVLPAIKEVCYTMSCRMDNLSEQSLRLYRLTFMGACRKLYIAMTNSREVWDSLYNVENIKVPTSLQAVLGHRYVKLKMGRVVSVNYAPLSSDKVAGYLEAIQHGPFMQDIMNRLCPFIHHTRSPISLNILASLYYTKLDKHQVASETDENTWAWAKNQPVSLSWIQQMGFRAYSEAQWAQYTRILKSQKELQTFLEQSWVICGLARQRIYKGILEPLLNKLIEDLMFYLAGQWNPWLYMDGRASPIRLMEYLEEMAGKQAGSRTLMLDWLINYVMKNTEEWLQRLEHPQILDPSGQYFMTVLNEAMKQLAPTSEHRLTYQDQHLVMCVA